MCAHISKRQLWIETDNRTQQKHHQDCKELVEMRAQIHFFKLSFTYQQKTTNDSVDYMRSRKRKQNKHNFYLTFQYIHVFSFMMWIQFILIIKTENLRNALKKKNNKKTRKTKAKWKQWLDQTPSKFGRIKDMTLRSLRITKNIAYDREKWRLFFVFIFVYLFLPSLP